MHDILLPIHSLLRWALLILLITVIIKSLNGMMSGRAFSASDNKLSLMLMISAHLQLVAGLWLYFISPYVQFGSETMKDKEVRFFTMEHSVMMLIAIVLITLGRITSKKATDSKVKFKRIFIFCIIALLVIIAAIPWPGMHPESHWF